MAVEVASLKAVLELDKGNFESGLNGAKQELGSFGSTMQSMLSSAGGFLVAQGVQMGLSAITSSITNSIAAAREAVAINKQLEQVIKSTGGAAGVTADAARSLADELGRVTNFEDDAVLSGENMLLTFTNIGSDVFPRATETMLDMSQALGQDLKSSAIQLGKALNDPIKGATALQRVGVTFSATQKDQIKNFVQMNDLASAQGVILDELAREFGGSARALADPIIQLQNAWGNLQEKFGTSVLLPVLNSLAQVVLPGVNAAIDNFKTAISGLTAEEMATISKTFTDLVGILTGASAAFNELGKGIVAMAAGLGMGDKNATGLGVTLKILGVVLQASLAPIQGLTSIMNILGAVLQSIGAVLGYIGQGFAAVGNAISQAVGQSSAIMSVWNALSSAMGTLSGWIARVQLGWDRLVASLSQGVSLPTNLTPGSPTPLEMGLRGIANAISTMPPLASGFGGSIPMAATGGGGSTINVNIGGVSASTTTNGDPATEAIRLTIQMLRAQLSR